MSEDSHFPLGAFFICVGFFVVYVIEAMVHKAFGGDGHGHSHGVPTAGAESAPAATVATSTTENVEMDDSSSSGSSGRGAEREGIDNAGFVHHAETAVGNGSVSSTRGDV